MTHITHPQIPKPSFAGRFVLDQRTENGQLDWLFGLFETSLRVCIPSVICPRLAVAVDTAEVKKRYGDFCIW